MDRKIQTKHFEYMVAMLEKDRNKITNQRHKIKSDLHVGSNRNGQCVNEEQ